LNISFSGRVESWMNSLMGELATQFGNAMNTGRGALRGAIGKMNDEGVWMPL
jgi:hypothetical protein